jgi:drug/metabolite transporter (DMT)-like permease
MVKEVIIGMIIIALGSILGSFGMVLFKKASSQTKGMILLLKNKNFLFGVSLNGIGAISLIYALRFGDLSTLYPLAGLNYIWVAIFSKFILKEKINNYKWTGISFIIIGVIFIGLGA